MIDLADLEKARAVIEKAIVAARAHEWLLRFAPTNDDDDCTVTVRQHHGSACLGSAEGHVYLNAAAWSMRSKIGDEALKLASAELEAAREAMAKIKSEAS